MIKQYIYVRTDMASMTPGRVAAMCAHASSDMADHISETNNYELWRGDFTFGTTIVKNGYNMEFMENIVNNVLPELSKTGNVRWNWVTDPEYHIQDGSVTHIIPDVTTALWILIEDSEENSLANIGDLYRG